MRSLLSRDAREGSTATDAVTRYSRRYIRVFAEGPNEVLQGYLRLGVESRRCYRHMHAAMVSVRGQS